MGVFHNLAWWRYRLDTPRPLTDNSYTCSKPKSVARDYLDSLDSVALQIKIDDMMHFYVHACYAN